MAIQIDWKWCQTTTCRHKLNKRHPYALELLKDICKREGCKENFLTSQKAWNLDLIEKTKAKTEGRSRRSTMDCFFAVKSGKVTKAKLVDFKSNTKSKVPNIDKSLIVKKIDYSRSLIGMNHSLHQWPVLVYPQDRIQQAKSNVFRKFGGRPLIEVRTITELSTFFD